MKRVVTLSVIAAVALLGQGIAQAAYVRDLIVYDGITENQVSTTNLARVFAADGTPVSPNFDQLVVGDILVAVLKGYQLNGVMDNVYGGELTALLGLKVTSKNSTLKTYEFGPVDPWPFGRYGIPAPSDLNIVLEIWTEPTKDFAVGKPLGSLGNVGLDVQAARDGTLFAAFGFGSAVDGQPMGTPRLLGYYSNSLISLRGGLNVRQIGPEVGVFPGVTNPVTLGQNSLAISIEFRNIQGQNLGGAPLPWSFGSEDVITFRVTPEPGTLAALLSFGAAGGLGLAIRRRRS